MDTFAVVRHSWKDDSRCLDAPLVAVMVVKRIKHAGLWCCHTFDVHPIASAYTYHLIALWIVAGLKADALPL